MIKLELPCSVKLKDAIGADPSDAGRVKFNVGPGDRGTQIVLLRLSAEQLAELEEGKRYTITIEPVDTNAPEGAGEAEE